MNPKFFISIPYIHKNGVQIMRNLMIAVLFLFSSAAILGCDIGSKEGSFASTGTGTKAANFALKSVDGKTIKLSDYKGKIVILDFWATWCPPCRKGIPDLIAIQNQFKKDVIVIGISVDTQTKKEVPGFVANYGINYPVVYFDEKVVKDYGGISAIPTSFVVDQKGNIVDQHVGLVSKDVFVNKINDLLKKK